MKNNHWKHQDGQNSLNLPIRDLDAEAGRSRPADSGSAAVHVCEEAVFWSAAPSLWSPPGSDIYPFPQKPPPGFVRTKG